MGDLTLALWLISSFSWKALIKSVMPSEGREAKRQTTTENRQAANRKIKICKRQPATGSLQHSTCHIQPATFRHRAMRRAQQLLCGSKNPLEALPAAKSLPSDSNDASNDIVKSEARLAALQVAGCNFPVAACGPRLIFWHGASTDRRGARGERQGVGSNCIRLAIWGTRSPTLTLGLHMGSFFCPMCAGINGNLGHLDYFGIGNSYRAAVQSSLIPWATK